MKKLLKVLYIVVVAVMAAATFVEHSGGARLYDAWWFTVLWALLAAAGIAWMVQRRVRRPSVVALHLAFVLILAGALLTRLFSHQGIVHLREGIPSAQYMTSDGGLHPLPFTLRLDSFVVSYHEGTLAAADYASHLTLTDDGRQQPAVVSMNHICTHRGIRLYQSSYDADGRGSVLAMNSDPWGITLTYAGYGLLFLSLLWMLVDPRGAYRQVLRSPLLRRGVLALPALLACGQAATAQTEAAPRALPRETADRFGRLCMLYNDRICPLQTYALDFTKKLCGKGHYGQFTAEQVLTGFIFYSEDWSREPLLKVKSSALRQTLQLPGRAAVSSFFTDGSYMLGPYLQRYHQGGQHDALCRAAAEMDDRLMLVMDLTHQGSSMRLFPYTMHGTTTWHAPTDALADDLPADDQLYIRSIFVLLYDEIHRGRYDRVDEYLDKMLAYQQKNGGTSLPSPAQLWAERLYNAVPFATILFMVCLTMGFITLAFTISRIVRRRPKAPISNSQSSIFNLQSSIFNFQFSISLLLLSFLALTLCEALRWMIRGTIPMSNGYETMLLMAWLIQLTTLLLCRRFRILLTFGFLLSGFFLLVSHISQMDPQIGHLMPVLRSPLLTLHVGIIMMAFALLSLTFICGVTALVVRLISRDSAESLAALAMLSRVFLYPALAMLGIGIFIGAIWANISWGNYWSWDPKETWALITFMVYAVALHTQSLPGLRRPVAYHAYVTLAFLCILMTYFGVNYLLGGLHSYA